MALTKVTKTGITNDSVNAAKLENASITSADISPGTLTNAKLANSSITVNGSSVSLGGSVDTTYISWQSVITADGSTTTTAVAGNGYFIDTTSAAHTINLPASPSAGDTVAIKDYAGTFGTNALTIGRNSENIQGVANNSELSTNRASVILVYVDATKGWLYSNESNVADLQAPFYISASGGTETTSGDFKIHTFTGDGCFTVSSLGGGGTPCAQSSTVDYLVVAGGGGGGATSSYSGGGAGAGGFRESKDSTLSSPHTASPLAATTGLTVTATTYPVTVGAGGPAGAPPLNNGVNGSNSIFSTITSAGGGGGGGLNGPTSGAGSSGGSGGGGGYTPGPGAGGSGNTPPVSPPQGNSGGSGGPGGGTDDRSGGGGGATQTGTPSYSTPTAGDGGDGATTSISGSTTTYAGGGGGGGRDVAGGTGGTGGGGSGNPSNPGAQSGTANTGGGAAGASPGTAAGTGGKGIVIIRYKYQ